MDNIQEVINELLRMKKEYNAPQACSVQSQQRNQYRSECLHIALAALREKQERERGCEYCIGENPPTLFENGETTIYYHPKHGRFLDGTYELNWKACPMCECRLEVEHWRLSHEGV